MPHIHTKPGQHDLTACGIIIRTDQAEPKVYLHRHKKLGTYMQFGGHVELHENVWQAVSHEIKEESGYSIEQLKILQPKVRMKKMSEAKLHPVPACINTHAFDQEETHFHIDISFCFVTSEAPNSDVADGESDDFVLLTKQEIKNLGKDKMFANIKEQLLFCLDEILPTWEEINTLEFTTA